MSDTYTLDQIRAAFWAEFHESGEWWFDYLSDPQENEKSTQTYWDTFVQQLREPQEHERV